MLDRRSSRTPADRARSDRVAEILREVEVGGDEALRRLSVAIDGLEPDLRITPSRQTQSPEEDRLIESLEFLAANIREFAASQLSCFMELDYKTADARLGHRRIPVLSAGIYVPGGRYRLLTSAQMAAIVAREAGVERLVMCTPPAVALEDRRRLETLAWHCGVDELHFVGGPHAIAAMAFGTASVTPVDMIVGPGGPWVQEAKRQVFGICGIDQIAGPTELVLLVDSSSPGRLVALDVVAQCEHGPTSSVVVVSIGLSDAALTKLRQDIDEALLTTKNSEVARDSWHGSGAICPMPTLNAAVALVDDMAPEHVQIMTEDPWSVLGRLRNYGAAFLGPLTTTALGDKGIGPNHILPTGCTAKFGSGLSVNTFLRFPTFAELLPTARTELIEATTRVARTEGLFGHADSLAERFQMLSPNKNDGLPRKSAGTAVATGALSVDRMGAARQSND